jgi:glycosyltransferase involved in cell wall biosynthesis
MKVLFLIPHLSLGGTEKVLSTVSCHLPNEIEQVIVVFEDRVTYPYSGRLVSLQSPNRTGSIFLRGYLFLQRWLRFRRIIKKEQPDVVLSFMEEANVLNVLTCKNPLLSVHTNVSLYKKTIINRIVRLCIRVLFTDKHIIAVSNGLKQDLIESFGLSPGKISVIYNPIDINGIEQQVAQIVGRDRSDSEQVIVTCGRLELEKGQWHLIKVLANLRKELPCRLVIVGQGSLRSHLMKLADQLGVGEFVDFVGWQENPCYLFKQADLFVLSSYRESFGNVLVEAMACGLPVISTNCPFGPKEILADQELGPTSNSYKLAKYGILTPAFQDWDCESLEVTELELVMKAAILRLLQDASLRDEYIHLGRMRARDFDAQKVSQDYMNLFIKHANK